MNKIVYPILVLLIVMGFTSCGSDEPENSQKVAFMDSATVFESFEMKKDYDIKIEKDIKAEADAVDALAELLNREFSAENSAEELELKRQYYIAENQFKIKFDELSTTYTQEVNERLNSYVEEYGKSNGYSIIFGSSGQGNVMYVNESEDITKEIIEFVNKKYSK